MQLRLRTLQHVRIFTVSVTAFALSGSMVLQYLMLPQPLFSQYIFTNALITVMLSTPISFFIGLKIMDVQDLAVRLQHAVNHDSLTGACTRLSFYHRLADLEEDRLVVIVADIDHFKQINDRYGHKAGDSALRQFAGILKRNCREGDVIARFGGEEFTILLRDSTLAEGVQTAQRLCDRVRAKTLVAHGTRLRLTASFGVAEVLSVGTVDDAIHRADLAAFRAKRQGRDRVFEYDPEQDTSLPDAESLFPAPPADAARIPADHDGS